MPDSPAVLGPQAYERRTVPDLLERSRALGEERPVLFDVASSREFSFGEFLDLVAGAATKLLERFEPGDRIAVMASNGAEYFILRYALSCAGLVEVALNGSHRGPILAHMLDITQPRAIVVEERYAAHLDEAVGADRPMDRISAERNAGNGFQPLRLGGAATGCHRAR